MLPQINKIYDELYEHKCANCHIAYHRVSLCAIYYGYAWDYKKNAIIKQILQKVKLQKTVTDVLLTLLVDSTNLLLFLFQKRFANGLFIQGILFKRGLFLFPVGLRIWLGFIFEVFD